MNKNDFYLIPDWPAPQGVYAATTLRLGGASTGGYGDLNMAMHVGDDPSAVGQNRARVRALLNLPAEPKWLAQTHSDRAVDAATLDGTETADASFTDRPGIVCAVLTADCLPVLACSRDGQKIAAIHGGWRGLLAGIISNTLQMMQADEVLVWLGPAIGPSCFEVGTEVRELFLAKSGRYEPAFISGDDGKWLADIYQLARIELTGLGISQVYGGGFCTVTETGRFFSYRRNPVTGRMATLIWRT